jgi:hypothetical protein
MGIKMDDEVGTDTGGKQQKSEQCIMEMEETCRGERDVQQSAH